MIDCAWVPTLIAQEFIIINFNIRVLGNVYHRVQLGEHPTILLYFSVLLCSLLSFLSLVVLTLALTDVILKALY